MINVYNAGIPDNGPRRPGRRDDGEALWLKKSNERVALCGDGAGQAQVGVVHGQGLQRFAETGGWGYAQFAYDPASDTFKPNGNGIGVWLRMSHARESARLRLHQLRSAVNQWVTAIAASLGPPRIEYRPCRPT